MTAKPLEGRVALVTGASRGIGYFTAIALAEAGAHVIAIARTVGGLEELDDAIKAVGGEATLVPMDLTDAEAYPRLAAAIDGRWGKLDILIGNAGALGTLSPMGHIKLKDWAQVMDVNVNANFLLIRALDPLLQKSDAGRAIFVTSGASKNQRAYWGAYATSKAALDAMINVYAKECDKTNVRVNLVNPGPMRTGMRAKAMPGEDPETLPHPRELTPLFVELASPSCTRHGEWVQFERS